MIGAFHIALSLAGLDRSKGAAWGQSAREAIEWAASIGARRVVLDAIAPGVRARELDRSGRRDLASLLRRLGLSFAGLDAWIPSTHFLDPVHTDRALDAMDGAIALCAELSDLSGATGRVVSVTLPEAISVLVAGRIASSAERAGVVIADHATPRGAESSRHAPIIGAGIDPAGLLAAGQDPVAAVSAAKEPPAAARLTDLSGAGRVVPGTRGGRLVMDAYAAALHVSGYRGPLIADLRHINEQAAGAAVLVGLESTAR